jgi:hypothetical protein
MALGLAAIAALVAATYRPFGGHEVTAQARISDPKKSGFDTGLNALQLAPEEFARFKTDERLAQYLATRNGVAKEVRDVWCAEFVKGLNAAREMEAGLTPKSGR